MSEADDRARGAASAADGGETDAADPGADSIGIPTETRGDGGVGSVGGVSGVGTIGADFGVAGNIPEPPGAYEEPVVIENEDDPDAIAHRGETDDDPLGPTGVGPEVRPPS
jgi:hypothetical protein